MRPETVAVKKQYEKPMLHVIDLAADEVLGVGCKATSGGSATGNTCAASSCGEVGS